MNYLFRKYSREPRIVESRDCWACGKPSGEATYCLRCADEWRALEIYRLRRMYALTPGEETAQQKLRAALASRLTFRNVFNAVNVALIAGVVLYVAGHYLWAFLQWMNEGGMR